MFKNTKQYRNLAKLMLLVVLFSACEKTNEIKKAIEKQETEIILGKKYRTSFDWQTKDPFKKIDIDTVKITGLKNGYVEWEYSDGIKQSSEIRIFRLLLVHNQ